MSRKATLFVRLPFLLILGTSLFAQMQPPPPAPEMQKASFLVGDWKTEGEMKPSAMMPSGGKFNANDHFEWMKGNYFLVGHSDFTMSGQSGTELTIMGFDAQQKVYTYNTYNSMGQAESSTGKNNGDTWIWDSTMDVGGGQTMKGRFTMKIVSPTAYNYTFEMSPDGTKWMTVLEGKSTKVK